MTARTITGTLPTYPLDMVRFRQLAAFVTGSATYPAIEYHASTSQAGAFSIALPVPDTGNTLYRIALPDGSAAEIYIGAGSATTLEALLAAALTLSDNPDYLAVLDQLVDDHAAIVASTSVLGHVKIDGSTITIAGGVISTSAAQVGAQPLDSDLTAIAALSTTAYGRSVLALADAAALRSLSGAAQAIAHGRPKTGSTYAYVIPGVDLISAATVTLATNEIRYEQFLVATPISIDQILCEVTAAAAAGKAIRLGIYNADSDWQPTSLVLDAGTVAADAIAVKTLALGSPQLLPAGRYLAALNTDGTPTMRCLRGGGELSGVTLALGASPFVVSLLAAQVYAPLPSTGLAWSTLTAGGGSPAQHCVMFRVSAP